MKRFITSLAFFSAIASCSAVAQEQKSTSFEGRVDYTIMSDGVEWTYSLWLKDSLWRAELKQGITQYELRLGDSKLGTAFLVNEGGKSFRPIFFERIPSPGARDKKETQNKKPIELSKIVDLTSDVTTIDNHSARLYVLKGPGAKMDVWMSPDLGTYSGSAIPLFKKTQVKGAAFVAFFNEYQGIPLAIEESGKSGKKAFSIRATKIERISLQESFLLLPDDFKAQARGGFRAGAPGAGNRNGQGNRSGRPRGAR